MKLPCVLIAGLLTLSTLSWVPVLLGGPEQWADSHRSPPAPRASGPAALLFVRVQGPAGLQATFFPSAGPSRTFDAPVAIGLRPGYIYRFQIAGLPRRPDHPDVVSSLFPTLEVRGTVALAPGLNAANFPVPLVFSADDIAHAQDGAFITKVIYLEHPDQAQAFASSLDQPPEVRIGPGGDVLAEARERGRPVLIVRFGERQAEPQDLTRVAIPGTVLLPGERALAPAAQPPWIPWRCWPVYDPILGPKPPQEECLKDGGDVGVRVGLGASGQLYGLDPTDTVAEYSDTRGRRHVAISNRVCIFAPRFAVLQEEINAIGYDLVEVVGAAQTAVEESTVRRRQPSQEARLPVALGGAVGRQSASGAQVTQGTIPVDQFLGIIAAEGRMKGMDVVATVQQERQMPPERPLVLTKWADKQAAQVGDVITFHLRYSNHGGQPITGVIVSDSLSGRLEYIPGSARADRDAVFTTQANEAGSLILRWEVNGSLLPSESGVVTFQARVR
jgi:uncharacterized repeat protein (TIGR01451 family)